MVALTDEERELAIKEAMVKKHARLEDDRRKRLAEEARKEHTKRWTPKELYSLAEQRASHIIQLETGNPEAKFKPLKWQEDAINALSLYFTDSPQFEKLDAAKYNDTGFGFSLQKGIWLWSNPGQGKTLMMQMFALNKRLPYTVVQCQKIVAGYVKYGDDHISHYTKIGQAVASYSNFFHKTQGFCFNDLGTETLAAKHYGTPINVMESIFLDTYENRVPFFHRHVTTNLTFDQLRESYGVRFTDRIKQCYNIIQLKGESLRK